MIIGRDLRFDTSTHRLASTAPTTGTRKARRTTDARGIRYTDDDLLRFVTNIYSVLLTRGIRGTYVYVCDPALRAYLAQYLPKAGAATAG